MRGPDDTYITKNAAPGPWQPPGWTALWIIGSILLWLLYTVVFVVTTQTTMETALRDAFANVLPAALLAAALHELLKVWVMPRSVPVQFAAHFGLAILFSGAWYALTIVTLAFLSKLFGDSDTIYPFTGLAATWQSFQGLILYGLIAATCYALRGGRQTAAVTIVDSKPLDRYLVRDDEGMRPVDVDEIITITGAQDYSEVVTHSGLHLVRMSLGEFEERLDTTKFIRVHRSAIINFKELLRTELAGGGRMIAHMSNGQIIQVSRSGARMLRSFMV